MNLYPAIDLLDGKCVRLRRGDFHQVSVYSERPVDVAAGFARAGAEWIHVVDLDAARTGVQDNLEVIREMAAVAGVRLQVGGGLRSREAIDRMLHCGVSRCVVGTAALDWSLLQSLESEFSGRLAVGMDVDGGTVRVAGWRQDSGIDVDTFLSRLKRSPVRWLIVTDISRDGMLSGPNVALLKETIDQGFQVIASGGIASLEDLRLLQRELPGLEGAIVGKAIYEKKFTVEEALASLRPGRE